eukprot:COSAG01_NODE_45980_length_404_cov_1.186885_1_plen_52_part_10
MGPAGAENHPWNSLITGAEFMPGPGHSAADSLLKVPSQRTAVILVDLPVHIT